MRVPDVAWQSAPSAAIVIIGMPRHKTSAIGTPGTGRLCSQPVPGWPLTWLQPIACYSELRRLQHTL